MIAGYILLDEEWFITVCILYILAFYLFSKRIAFAVIWLLLLVSLTDSYIVTVSAATIWVVGDGFAGLVGSAFGKRRWPWHTHKTILGSASFLAGSFPAVLVVLVSTIDAPLQSLILLSLIPSLGACIIEVQPITSVRDIKIDDNLLVLMSSALLIYLLFDWLGVEAAF
jgi:dolichol kinase